MLKRTTGFESKNLVRCTVENQTVTHCPVSLKENFEKEDFIVVVHNQGGS